ncbi:MAG: hypothetical protein ACLS9K_01450 [Lachnospira eligens]
MKDALTRLKTAVDDDSDKASQNQTTSDARNSGMLGCFNSFFSTY